MPSGPKPVNIIRADVRTTKKRKAKAANAKTKKEEAASRSKTPAGGKSFMKNRRLPMAIFKEKGESGDMDMEEDGNTVNEASTRHESVPKRRACKLTFDLLLEHLQMDRTTEAEMKRRISSDPMKNPYVNKVYENSKIQDVQEPTREPERPVERSLSWLRESFKKAELLLPDDWKTFIPKEMCKSYKLPAEWAQFLETKDLGLFPNSPDTCELPTASSDDPSQKEAMDLWRKVYTLSENPELNHLLATLFYREVSTRNELHARAQTHNYIMEKLTTGTNGELKQVPGVLFLPREQILARNISGCEGNILYNEYNPDRQKTPQEFIKKWLDFCGNSMFREHADDHDHESEMATERKVGHLVHGLYPKAGVFTTLSNQFCIFPPLLTYFGSPAKPDFARRPASAMLPGWDKRLLPALWVIEAKANRTTPDPLYGAPQVAPVVLPVIVMFILFYLDTRQTLDEGLPPWSFIFSLVCNQEGYNIYVHYPRYDRDLKMWGAYSMLFSEHETIFQSEADSRTRIHGLAIMQRMQSHELFVLERFMEWTERGGYKRHIKELGFGL